MTSLLCKTHELPSSGCKEYSLQGKPIFVVAHNNEHKAYVNECPHLGIDLNWAPDKFLDGDNKYIQCSMHGALFEVKDGECIHGPCQGQYLQPVELEQRGDDVFAKTI